MYLFAMNKPASFLPSQMIGIKLTTATANFYVLQNTQMMHKTDGHFVLLKKSNTSLLIALIVQSVELTPTKSKQSLRCKRLYPRNLVSNEQHIIVAPYSWLYYLVLF